MSLSSSISLLLLALTMSAFGVKEEGQKQPQELTLTVNQVHPQSAKLAPQIAKGEEVAPPGTVLKHLPILDDAGKKIGTTPLLIFRRAIATQEHVQRATVVPTRFGTVAVLLTEAGGKRLHNATKQMRMGVDRMAVVLNGKLLIAPTIRGTLGREFIIEGLDGAEEARRVAKALNQRK